LSWGSWLMVVGSLVVGCLAF